jgi:predicted HicB family RNase H-like nuclease
MKPYMGYVPSIWFEADDRSFHGVVEGLRDTVHFTGVSVDELEAAFHNNVDVYLEACVEDGIEPEKPWSGKLAFRTTPDHHRMIAEAAARRAKSINQWMDEALTEAAKQVIAEGGQVVRTR